MFRFCSNRKKTSYRLEEKIDFIIQKLHKMSQENDDLQALVSSVKSDLIAVQADLSTIKTGVIAIISKLPSSGGLTPEETSALKVSLTDLAGSSATTKAAADEEAAEVSADGQPAAAAPAQTVSPASGTGSADATN